MDEAENGSPFTAIEYFNKELADNPKNGYAHLGLSIMRQTEGFKALYEQNKDRFENKYVNSEQEVIYEDISSPETVEIPFTPEGGCASVKTGT